MPFFIYRLRDETTPIGMNFERLINKKVKRLFGVILLFSVVGWAFYIHLPTFKNGYLNAGDDHIHVAYSNELKKIWQEEGKSFGWSRLYGVGAPIFLLRPPGFYVVTNILHFLTGLSIEHALKIVVLLGFCLFPLSVFIGGRLLGLGFSASIFAGMLSPLPISLWGHTIDAYQYLGVHKQLLAILIFPPTVGALWRLLKGGRCGLLFAVLFPVMFLTHPYIAYCFALLVPGILLVLVTIEPSWDWKKGISRTALWTIPAVLSLSIWLIPFLTSQEIQVIDPYLSRRADFDVVGCTTAETLRQFILGGILDTTKYAGTYGGSKWALGNEWGWLDNSDLFRIPILTVLTIIGWLVVLIRPKSAARGFLGITFLLSFILFIGPDDFPWQDWIPNAKKFQNIHAIFLLDWVSIMLGGLAGHWLFKQVWRIPKRMIKYTVVVLLTVSMLFAYGSAVYERTESGKKLIDVRNIYTRNGSLELREKMNNEWRVFNTVVEELKTSDKSGNIAAFPAGFHDGSLYNLLPHMVGRPVFISGFEKVGGLYSILLGTFRAALRDNYHLQKLFNIRFVVNSPHRRKLEMKWHNSIRPIIKNRYWELVEVQGKFGDFEPIPLNFFGFIGSERTWARLMELWLRAVMGGEKSLPWIINMNHSSLAEGDVHRIKPYVKKLILESGFGVPDVLGDMEVRSYEALGRNAISKLKIDLHNKRALDDFRASSGQFKYDVIKKTRTEETFKVNVGSRSMPLLFKRAFYRGWKARIDGEETPIYHVSPGLQMILVSEGKHILNWHYTGPNNWRWAAAAFWFSIIFSSLLIWGKNLKFLLPAKYLMKFEGKER